ncbi:MAG: hypothetical protein AUJ97_03610 [Bacteroidetes bacterium CG2_30_32_10]|nr:MAG: hypothetical protein AUJ97_03610 [Bacteroidetes bacterium CG2_30_32_10]
MATIKRNRTLSLLFLFFCNTIAIAQTQPDTNKSTKFSYATPFQLLEPKYITTGILHNRVIDYSKIQKFQGLTTDSITDYNNWYQMYWELSRADIKKSTSLPNIYEVQKNATEKEKKGVIQIGIINMFYNTIKPDAIDKGQLKMENNQLKDVLPRNGTPYETKRCFTIAPLSESILSGNNTFVFNSDFYFSNTGESIQSIIVDLDDGMGKRNLMINQPFSISCLTSGIKTISIAMQTNNKQTYYAKTTINKYRYKKGRLLLSGA